MQKSIRALFLALVLGLSLALASVALQAIADTAAAGPIQVPTSGHAGTSLDCTQQECIFIFKDKGISLFSKQDENSAVLGKSVAPTDFSGKLSNDGKWVLAKEMHHRTEWIRRSDVLTLSDFKKVASCWPVSSLKWDDGDYEIVMEMKTDGSAVMDDGWTGHVFYRNGLALIVPSDGGMMFEGELDETTGQFKFWIFDLLDMEYFGKSALAGCKGGPVIASNDNTESHKP